MTRTRSGRGAALGSIRSSGGISRRALLKGMLGGAAITVALPPLECFFDVARRAGAASPFPTRFGVWFWGNGVLPDRWTPLTTGAGWEPSKLLAPLLGVRDHVTVVSGTKILSTNTVPHGSGPAGLLTGDDMKSDTVTGPTLDQIIAREIGSETRFRSIEAGVQRGASGVFASGPNQPAPTESSPHALFNRLFVDGYRAPGDMSMPDPKIGLRRSVLDAVTAQAGRLRARVGTSDRQRIDAHLDGVRSLEMQLARLQQSPPALAACSKPAEPLADYPDVDGRAQMKAVSRAVSDILVMALACDQTRVFSNMFSRPVNNTLFLDVKQGHHQLTHDEPDPQPQVERILTFILGELAYFIDALSKVKEGDGTLLDHTALLCMSDCSLGRTHSLADYPILVAGGGNGTLKQGVHYHSASGENACSVSLALLRAMGVHAQSFGVGVAQTSSALSAILV